MWFTGPSNGSLFFSPSYVAKKTAAKTSLAPTSISNKQRYAHLQANCQLPHYQHPCKSPSVHQQPRNPAVLVTVSSRCRWGRTASPHWFRRLRLPEKPIGNASTPRAHMTWLCAEAYQQGLEESRCRLHFLDDSHIVFHYCGEEEVKVWRKE